MITGLLYMLAALLVVLWMTSLVFAEIEWRIRKRRIQRNWDQAEARLRRAEIEMIE